MGEICEGVLREELSKKVEDATKESGEELENGAEEFINF